MKRLAVLSVVCISMFLPFVAAAHDVFPPDWRGLDGTTYQEWQFGSNATPAVPDVINNIYGGASASVTVGEFGEGWLANPGLGTQTGIWDLGGTGGQIVLDIDNRPLPLDYKEIWVQVTYYQAISVAPTVAVLGAQFISSQTTLIEADGALGGWYLDQSVWRIKPKPSHEQIILTSNPSWGSVIDQIVVDTASIHADCIVDFDDLLRFCEQWLQTGSNLEFDLDNSGRVDFKDFSIFANSWLDICPRGEN